MTGNNELILNAATMAKVVQEYLDKRFCEEGIPLVHVVGVTSKVDRMVEMFHVKLAGPKKDYVKDA